MKNNIRNFSIIAHIDHGKTTLTDRVLELTKTVERRKMRDRHLDSHPISQERGVTIKLAPVRMNYHYNGNDYILNLIDTPGHIDFSYEVSRSLACCEGAVLLVDATQGIQAQTLANYNLASNLGLKIIPVVNKIDVESAQPEQVAADLINSLGFLKEEILYVSAKTGENIELVLKAVINKIPAPKENEKLTLRALIFDSFYHSHKGVVAYVRVFDGQLDIKKESMLKFLASKVEFKPQEIGFLVPSMKKANKIGSGEVGYIATGLKDLSFCQVGDTITSAQSLKKGEIVKPLPGYVEPKPLVFFDFYPVENKDFPLLQEALEQLKLNDFSLHFTAVGSPALGKGFRVGFLGVFHAVITQERLERDFNLDIVITSPSVEYQLIQKDNNIETIQNASQLPDINTIKEIREPWIKATIFSPLQYLGGIFELCQKKRGQLVNQEYLGLFTKLEYELPLIELVEGFFDELKSISSGFASLDYQVLDFRAFKATRLEVLINRQKVDALSIIVEVSKGEKLSQKLAKKLKEVIPRQQFETPIQVTLNGRIMARETIKAFRKNVTAKLYGGDQTRKDKLLKKQKKGKKRMKQIGRVIVPQEAFMAVLEVK
ncbi:translation elongation factor 4 [Patescibacteria group bacterium]